jgi:uncharacterized membrane protein
MSPAPFATAVPSAMPAPFVRHSRNLAVGALLALIVLGLAWELWLAPTGARTLAIKVLPLLIPLAGLLRYRLYTYRWVSLLVWLYFTEGVVRAWPGGPGWGPWLALGQVGLCLVLFAACAAHVRWRLRHRSQPEPLQPGAPA